MIYDDVVITTVARLVKHCNAKVIRFDSQEAPTN